MARSLMRQSQLVGTTAVGVTTMLGLQLLTLGPSLFGLTVVMVAAAVTLMVWGCIFGRMGTVTAASAAALIAYSLTLSGKSASSLAVAVAPAVTAGLVLATELGWWAIELRKPVHEVGLARWRRVGPLGAAATIAAGLAEVILVASRVHAGRSMVLEGIAVLALLAMLSLFVVLAADHGLREVAPTMTGLPLRQPGENIGEGVSFRRRAAHRLRLLVHWLQGAPEMPARTRPRSPLSLRTAVAIFLLLLDLLGVGLALGTGYKAGVFGHTEPSVNSAPILTGALVIAGAIISGWLCILLRNLATPATASSLTNINHGAGTGEPAELKIIRIACRDARATRPGNSQTEPILEEISAALRNDSIAGEPSSDSERPIATLDSRLISLEDQITALERLANE
ncbi:MAG TPA: hypothetical protein VMW80_02690 [Candidatus Dormibacteraeota bacterium]|nr:hypothetical protein [Candidatus Dormibacteraeota bacterium]